MGKKGKTQHEYFDSAVFKVCVCKSAGRDIGVGGEGWAGSTLFFLQRTVWLWRLLHEQIFPLKQDRQAFTFVVADALTSDSWQRMRRRRHDACAVIHCPFSVLSSFSPWADSQHWYQILRFKLSSRDREHFWHPMHWQEGKYHFRLSGTVSELQAEKSEAQKFWTRCIKNKPV